MRKKELQLFNETLVRYKFFKYLFDAWKKSIHDRVHLLTYKKGEHIIRRGHAPGAFFMMGFGTVAAIMRDDRSGEEDEVKELVAGDFFGGMELLSGSMRSYDAVAKEDSLIFIMGRQDFLKMLEDNDDVQGIIEKNETFAHVRVLSADNGADGKNEPMKEGKSIISRLRGYLKLKKD